MSLDSSAARSLSVPRLISISLLCAVFAALAWRQHAFVDANAVNILFWDQWDFYHPFFHQGSLWDIFSYQHGPHRQGFGFLVTRCLAELSGWNVRWDAFAVSFLMIGAGLLGLRVAVRSGMKFGIGLALIPFLFLNIRQYEGFVGASNLSHGAMPIFLFMLYCLAWFWKSDAQRLVALSILTFFLIFTGFGIFVGLLTPPLLLIEGIHAFKAGERKRALWVGLAFASTLIAWGLFARGYTFSPAVEGFRFPYEKPIEYLYFVSLMFTNFFGVSGYDTTAIAIGTAITLSVTAICIFQGWQILWQGVDGSRTRVVIFCLSAYALLYVANTAVGRVFLGLSNAPAASRYIPLMIPGVLAILLQLGQISKPRLVLAVASCFAILTALGTLHLHAQDQTYVDWYRNGRQTWKDTYLHTHSQEAANKAAEFQIFPAPIPERLDYLEKNKLNFYRP